jgi:putative ABC transport system permease protein
LWSAKGASKDALARIQKLGSNNIIINSIKSLDEDSQSSQRSHMSIYGLTYLDYDRIRTSFPMVKKVAPAKLIRKESKVGSNTLELRIVGTTDEWVRNLCQDKYCRQEHSTTSDCENIAAGRGADGIRRKKTACEHKIPSDSHQIAEIPFARVVGIIKK